MKSPKYFFLASILTVALWRCSNEKKITQPYQAVKIYCWCFSHGHDIVNKDGTISKAPGSYHCETFVRVKPQNLIVQRNLSDSITNPAVMDKLNKLIFEGKTTAIPDDPKPDARFVIVFIRPNSEADRLTYANDTSFSYNEKYTYNYSFNVMDSIKKILGKKQISCPD